MKTALEIERKFLLKGFPESGKVIVLDTIKIEQYYCRDEKGNEFRIRSSNNEGQVTLTKTIKKFLSPGVYEETEGELGVEEYNILLESAYRFILKTRWVIKHPDNNLKWEIDVFPFKVVIAEIELPTIDFSLELPDFIKDCLIMEVTGIQEFSNKNLAKNYML